MEVRINSIICLTSRLIGNVVPAPVIALGFDW